MSKVFRLTPKRIKRTNGLVLTPEMSIVVTTRQHCNTPFYNGAEEIKEQYMRIYGFDYKKRAVLQMILSLRRFVKTLCPSDAEACAWIAREIL